MVCKALCRSKVQVRFYYHNNSRKNYNNLFKTCCHLNCLPQSIVGEATSNLPPLRGLTGINMHYNSSMNSSVLDFAEATPLPSHNALVGLCGTLFTIALYEFWFRNTHAFKTLKNMPGPTVWPLVGNAHLVAGLTNAQIMKKALLYLQHYGETVRGVLGNIMLVFLTNPADIEIILNSQQHLEKSEEYRFFKPWFGDGLLISNGEHWRHHRRMIAPTFHQSILKSFVPTFVEHSKRVVQRMKEHMGKEFDVHDHMSQTTVEILLTTAMGVKKLPEHNESSKYAQAVVDMCDIIHKRQVHIFYRNDYIYRLTQMATRGDRYMRTILGLTKRVINERKMNFNVETDGVLDAQQDLELEKNTKKEAGLRDDLDDIDESDVGAKRRLALLDSMVEMSKDPEIEWNEKDIMDEVNTIMFEGHDTTSAGSSFVLCLLGIYPEIQAKVLEEQKEIFGDDMKRDVTFVDTLKMNYLERVIKEALRLYPPVPIIARKVNQDVKLASGPYTIPKGTTVVLGQYAVHRREDIYPNPNKFDPDNFLPERVSKRHYYSYIPFSAGPRSCVGRKYAMLMLKCLLSTILRKYQVHSNRKESDFKLQADIILKLENGFKITLEERA